MPGDPPLDIGQIAFFAELLYFRKIILRGKYDPGLQYDNRHRASSPASSEGYIEDK
jgi:hypothetical protein